MKIHPATSIILGLLIVSLIFNYAQYRRIKELNEENAQIIIKPNIRLYEPPDEIIVTKRGRKGFDYN